MPQKHNTHWLLACVLLTGLAQAAGEKGTSGVKVKVESAETAPSAQNQQLPKAQFESQRADFLCEKLFEDFSIGTGAAKLTGLKLTSMFTGQNLKDELIAQARQQLWVPVPVETLIGDKLHASLIEKKQIMVDPEGELNKRDLAALRNADEILAKIVGNLPVDQPYVFKLYVSRDDGVNAAAYPGGHIYITRQALKLKNDELALMLAHEVSHVTKRHLVKEIQVKLVDSATAIADIQTLMSGDANKVGQGIGTLIGVGKLFEQFPVNQEHEADSCGLKLISNQANINTANAINGFMRLSSGRRANTGPIGSHPNYENRQQMMTLASQRFAGEKFVGAGSDKASTRASPLQAAATPAEQDKPTEQEGLGKLLGQWGDALKKATAQDPGEPPRSVAPPKTSY